MEDKGKGGAELCRWRHWCGVLSVYAVETRAVEQWWHPDHWPHPTLHPALTHCTYCTLHLQSRHWFNEGVEKFVIALGASVTLTNDHHIMVPAAHCTLCYNTFTSTATVALQYIAIIRPGVNHAIVWAPHCISSPGYRRCPGCGWCGLAGS